MRLLKLIQSVKLYAIYIIINVLYHNIWQIQNPVILMKHSYALIKLIQSLYTDLKFNYVYNNK